jgi:NAD(P)-dependent dehydrogenase (short-subunit alcohol dehydrogenase family)
MFNCTIATLETCLSKQCENNKINMAKVAIVTGSSSGTGLETSLLLTRNKFFTYATMRNLYKCEEILQIAAKEKLPLKTLQLDVNDDLSVNNAIDMYLKKMAL